MRELTYVSNSVAETEQLGAALARVAPDGLTIGLVGTLGAGKTLLVRSLAQACGVSRQTVVSPTFVICQQYTGDRALYHLDAYRLRDDDEFLELGVEEFFASSAVTLIEWADRVERCLPQDRLMVDIEVPSEQSRRFHFVAHGQKAASTLEALNLLLGDGEDPAGGLALTE